MVITLRAIALKLKKGVAKHDPLFKGEIITLRATALKLGRVRFQIRSFEISGKSLSPKRGESKIYSYTTFGARHTRTTSKSLGGPITSVKTRFEIALKHCQEFRIRHLCRRCGPFKNFRQITIAPKGDFRGIPYRVLFHALGMGHDFSKWIKFQL